MGSMANKLNSLSAPKGGMNKPVGGGGLTLKSISGTGPTLTNIPAAAQEAGARSAASTSARLGTEQQITQQKNIQQKGKLESLSKPLAELNFEDIYNATGDLNFTKDFFEARKSYSGGQMNQEKFMQQSVGLISGLIDFAKNIPESSGFSGKQIQGKINKANVQLGNLPELEAYEATANMVAPMIAKAFGDSGNVSDTQQKMLLPALLNLASGQKELRQSSQQILELLFSNASGKPVNFNKVVRPHPSQAIKEISNDELMRMLQQGMK